MKIRHLTRKSGAATVLVWPPIWDSSYSVGDKLATGDDGVLQSVRRDDDRLGLTMMYDGRKHVGGLQWTPPPNIEAVERVLMASTGKTIREIGDIDV